MTTLSIARTNAERALSESFDAVAGKLPGGRAVADVRRAAIDAFATLGLPHRRIEEWKYTDLRSALKQALAPATSDATPVLRADIDAALGAVAQLDAYRMVFVNGLYRAELSSPPQATGVDVMPFGTVLSSVAASSGDALGLGSDMAKDAVRALNTAFMTDGAVLTLARGAELGKPLLAVFVHAGAAPRLVTTRNIVRLEQGAKATVIEAHVTLDGAGEVQANTLTDVALGDGAHLTHVKCTLGRSGESHLGTWGLTLGAEAVYRAFQLTAGMALIRNNVFATFAGEDSKLDISGCFLGRGHEHIDTTLVIDHAVPGCESRELFKGVLADRARGVFQGKVIVRPDAQKTDGKQMAQALMLSEDAEFDSKPELEIHADDVVCGHGSTAAEIDENLMFYLRARGIPPDQARAMLIESFIGEAIDKIEDEKLREAVSALAVSRLAGISAAS